MTEVVVVAVAVGYFDVRSYKSVCSDLSDHGQAAWAVQTTTQCR